MKLSTETVNILKNFSSINSNIVISAGNQLKTMAEAKNVLANATVAEKFPAEFGIYDLGEFLGVLSMFEDPELDFDDDMNYVEVKEGTSKVKYFFSDPGILTTPSKPVKMPAADVSFKLTAADLAAIRKATSALGVNDLVISPVDGIVHATVTDVKDKTANSFSIDLGVSSDEEYSLVFNVANLKMISGDYDVEISSKLISKFANESGLEYFIALEKSSTYGA